MATEVQYNVLGWHEGESSIHRLLHVPEDQNPTSMGLSGYAIHLLQISTMLAVGTLDAEERPWTTLLGGEPGFARALGPNIAGVKALVGRKYDPVIEALIEADGKGKGLSALGIHLDSRDRVKLSGQYLGGGLVDPEDSLGNKSELQEDSAAELQMAFAVERSLGNCPKYLNKKTLIPATPQPVLASRAVPLCDEAVDLLSKADLFFVSTSYHTANMGTNHRGGPPGFVRLASNSSPQQTTLIYPEYSGNRLYQSLGNLMTTPKAGLVFPDFDTGDVLYITGTTEIAYGEEAAHILPRSNLLVKVHVTAARYIKQSLSFRARPGEPSPYNPQVRYLANEQHSSKLDKTTNNNDESSTLTVALIAKKLLTPTIARFRFQITDLSREAKPQWKAGQYVALAFEDELGMGYSHMRDDDPRSLNDDYVRTFTVSSPPPSAPPAPTSNLTASAEDAYFDITIRNVGTVTSFLFRYPIRSGLEVPLMGFGGSFALPVTNTDTDASKDKILPFIAGGIGITPLLAQLPELEAQGLLHHQQGVRRLRLYWAIHVRDLGLVVDTFERFPTLAGVTSIFVSGITRSGQEDDQKSLEQVRAILDGASEGGLVERRIMKTDLLTEETEQAETCYLCAGKALRKEVVSWMEGKKVVFEDFDY